MHDHTQPPGPVIVIGNGPVGQTAALLLARWGIRVIVLDAKPHRDPAGSKAICQQRDVLDIWQAVGAGSRIAAEGLTWQRARTFYRDRELSCATFHDRGRSSFPPMVNISQAQTEAILDERMAASPLIEVRWGLEVEALEQNDSGVSLTVRTTDNDFQLQAPYVIACGGARSHKLRAALGLTFPGRTFDDQFLICDIRAQLTGWEHERRFYFDPDWNPDRQVLIHACPDSTYRIDWQVPPQFDLARDERTGGLHRRIRQIIGERDYEIVWRSIYRFHSRHSDRLRVGRVLIAGDMAHLISPFGARGLNSGVADAENAAWKIGFVLRGWAREQLLESYHDERLAAALENIVVTSSTMDFLVPQTADAWRRRRDVLERALDDPTARAEIDSGRFAEPFWYVDSPLTTPRPDRPFPGRPPTGETPPSLPGVLIPDATIQVSNQPHLTRLREIARDGFLLLTTPGIDAVHAESTLHSVTTVHARVLRLAEIDIDGILAAALEPDTHEAWLIRPDGHIAAIVSDDDTELASAVQRCLGATIVPDERHPATI